VECKQIVLEHITPLILTFNEECNIERVLAPLEWARSVVVVDSGSNDHTVDILSRHPNVRTVARRFDTHANQWNFALTETGIDTDWVLALDADYVLSPDSIEELRSLTPRPDVAGYSARFRYCIFGRPIRGGAYPPVTVLYRRAKARYAQDGHTQRVRIDGMVEELGSPIDHDDRKPFRRWLESQQTYARLEADHLAASNPAELELVDRLRLMIWPVPAFMFLYTFLVRGGLLDGWRGLYYSLQRTYAELLLSLELLDRKLARAFRS
jgi:glycosyltransferase involved in cell wall biosynthesis